MPEELIKESELLKGRSLEKVCEKIDQRIVELRKAMDSLNFEVRQVFPLNRIVDKDGETYRIVDQQGAALTLCNVKTGRTIIQDVRWESERRGLTLHKKPVPHEQ